MNLRLTVLSGTAALLASLLLARVHPFGNAGLYARASLPQQNSMPPQVSAILANKCANCHSSQTRAPFYGRFAPVSWLMERDIVEGRKQMNLSMWDSYTLERQQTLQAKIVQATKSKRMPLPQYRAIHWGTAITPTELNELIAWAHSAAPEGGASTPSEGNVAAGKIVFEKRCTGCHSLEQNHEGPQLRGVFGRSAGSVHNFTYSAALKNSKITWDETTLDKWLTDPDAFVPGNNMDFRVAKPQERADLIRFLKESAAP